MALIELKNIDSTNNYIKQHHHDLNHFDVVITNHQTKGKGRRDNHWYSNKESLTFSILIKEKLDQMSIQLIPFYTAYIMRQVIDSYCDDTTVIKWPNDILIQDKKVSGILVESIIQGQQMAFIIGIGVNVNQISFPLEIKDIAVSLKQVLKQNIAQDKLLHKIIQSFKDQWKNYKKNPQKILAYCNQHLAFKNKIITFTNHQASFNGKCYGIDHLGHLVLTIHGVQKSFVSGEIQHIRQR